MNSIKYINTIKEYDAIIATQSPEVLANIETIYFNHTVEDTPKKISMFKNLTHFTICRRSNTSIPASLPIDLHLTQITNLELNGWNFTSFPMEICALKNLTHLDLYDNPIPIIPQELANLSLVYLNMSRTEITTIPDFICNIRIAYFEHCKLTDIPKFIRERETNAVWIDCIVPVNQFIHCKGQIFKLQEREFHEGKQWLTANNTTSSIEFVKMLLKSYEGLYWEKCIHKYCAISVKQAIMTMLMLASRNHEDAPKFAEGLIWTIPREILLEIFKFLPFYD